MLNCPSALCFGWFIYEILPFGWRAPVCTFISAPSPSLAFPVPQEGRQTCLGYIRNFLGQGSPPAVAVRSADLQSKVSKKSGCCKGYKLLLSLSCIEFHCVNIPQHEWNWRALC